MRIKELHVENFMGVEVVDVTPEEHVVTVGGKNGAGKSSVLNAIVASLGGAGSMPEVALRKGQKAGKIVTRVERPEGDLIVTRTIGEKGTKVTITTDEGAAFKRPQELLDGLIGALGFDPHEFTRLDSRKQAEQLRKLVGLDFSALDRQRSELYAERTNVNRDVNQQKTLIDKLHHYPDAPVEEVSVSELVTELQRREAVNREVDGLIQRAANAEQRAKTHRDHCETLKRQIAELQRQLKEETDLAVDAENNAKDLRDKAESADKLDVESIREQIGTAEDTNRKVRVNRNRADALERLKAAKEQADDLTRQIESIDAEKARQMAEAAWPVEGLGFDESGGVTFRGLPFTQASSAEQLRVSLAMGMALNPRLKVLLIRDGSLIDDETMAVIREQVEANDFQLWIEKVSRDGAGCSLVISEGRVAELATA